MTLQQIDQRLNLFPKYINYLVDYRINNPMCEAEKAMNDLNTYGFIYIKARRTNRYPFLKSFDEWLLFKGYGDLVELHKEIKWKKPTEHKSAYDGHAYRSYLDVDSDDYYWLALFQQDPELYAKLRAEEKERMAKIWDMAKTTLNTGGKVIGKAFITSTVESDNKLDFRNIWNNSQSE